MQELTNQLFSRTAERCPNAFPFFPIKTLVLHFQRSRLTLTIHGPPTIPIILHVSTIRHSRTNQIAGSLPYIRAGVEGVVGKAKLFRTSKRRSRKVLYWRVLRNQGLDKRSRQEYCGVVTSSARLLVMSRASKLTHSRVLPSIIGSKKNEVVCAGILRMLLEIFLC